MTKASVVLAIAAAAVLLAAATPAAAFETESTWTAARATFYGRDAWSIHTGSCGFGFICPNRWAGQLAQGSDVVAVPDGSDLYGHCGECLQVRCRSSSIPDGDGGTLDRTGVCLNDKSVKVKIVDTCPCNYPANAASNKRWCCGDFPHLDLAQFALEKIASDTDRWGVFAIDYRKIDCNLDIGSDAAPALADPAPDPHFSSKPANLDCGALPAENSRVASNRKSLTTEATSQQRATTSSGTKTYWQNFWHTTFRKFNADQKKAFYKKLWSRIRAGELTRQGHGKN